MLPLIQSMLLHIPPELLFAQPMLLLIQSALLHNQPKPLSIQPMLRLVQPMLHPRHTPAASAPLGAAAPAEKVPPCHSILCGGRCLHLLLLMHMRSPGRI
eukprot:362187-Pleurochrysis_carterae.AAC.2